jgi:hypothetical protein
MFVKDLFMKTCSYCGKEYSDEASVCAIDGQPLKSVAPPPAPPPITDRKQIVDDEHLRLLSIFHFVGAGFALLGMLFLLMHYAIMNAFVFNPEFWKSQKNVPPPPLEFMKMFVWFYIFFGTLLATACVLNLLSGIFLRQKRHRIFSLVVGGLNCLQIPFGTILGVFTIIVLSRDSVRVIYSNG